MIKTLYENFRHWSENGSVYVFSDPHFGDKNCSLIDKNWPNPDKQIKIINSIVGKSDTLICLGDVGDVNYIPKLKAGYKVLVTGNHDSGASAYLKQDIYVDVSPRNRLLQERYIKEGYHIYNVSGLCYAYKTNNLFDEVFTGPLFIAEKILLSHEPIGVPFALNIHGHDHSGKMDYDQSCHYLNVAANLVDYKPVNLGNLIKEGILSNIKDIHRLTIDRIND